MFALVFLLPSSFAQVELAPENDALIYVYSLWEAPHRSAVPIYCDGVLVAKVKRGYFFVISLPPGIHELEQKGSVPLIVDAQAKEKSFVSPGDVVQRTSSGELSIPTLQLIPPFVAKKAVTHLAYTNAREIYSKLVLKKDPDASSKPELGRRSDTQ